MSTSNSNLSINPFTGFDHGVFKEYYSHQPSFPLSCSFSNNYAGKFYEYIYKYIIKIEMVVYIK